MTRTAAEIDRSAMIGVGLMLLVAVINAVDAVLVRLMSPAVHPFIIGFTRSLFGLLVVLPWILARPRILRSHYRFRHVLRAALKLASLVAFFAAFASAPLADATAMAFTAPIFVSIGAWVFLSEQPRAIRVVASVLGFIGVLIVLRPGHGTGISIGLLYALLGALLTGVIQLILKPMSARDSTETLVAWNLILTVPIAIIPALWVWVTPTPAQWGFLALQGVLGALNMSLVTRALSLADASLIAPMDFLRLPIVAFLAFMIFGQTVSVSTWIGAAVIFGATLLMARSARSRKFREI
ncbi:DMT family transporter [Frigidibacter sp. ROC022]|uniref:DMT family transporter n=1 Tax=Frigidibacter sp. ROC022 TaxID=2971796 RepID=UPI00215B110D|nr:DMT family transporter [Frigidibacter sp. ROC022]MCR8725651.1 DMT family transporter [Frigidibacter sp. ROC022]